jgi:prepilin-type N-terminal cleavage/methylation domain-containing protein
MVRAYRRVSPNQSGLTLLECLVGIAIIAIMLAMALPSFRDQLATARARAGALQLYAAMQFARTKAQMQGISVILCPTNHILADKPACAGDFGQQIVAMADTAEGLELMRVWQPVQGVTVTDRSGLRAVTGELRWDQRGLGSRNLTLSVCALSQNWSVVTNRLGRPRLVAQWGTCPG